MTSLRVAFAGTPEVAVPSLERLAASRHHIVGVMTRPDAPTGRGRRVQANPIAQAATALRFPLVQPSSLADTSSLTNTAIDHVVAEWRPDVIVVVAYGLLIPERLLNVPRFGWINAHFSALPRWRGAAPVQHAIAAGDPTISVSIFRIEEGLDTGPILAQSAPIEIGEREDAGHLLGRLSTVAAEVLLHTVDGLATDSISPMPQSDEGCTLAPRITTDDARIDWQRPVDEVDRWIRACTPSPGAWTTLDGDRLRIGTPARVLHDPAVIPGRIYAEKARVLVGASGGCLELDAVQPTGKKAMPAADWARGYRGSVPASVDT